MPVANKSEIPIYCDGIYFYQHQLLDILAITILVGKQISEKNFCRFMSGDGKCELLKQAQYNRNGTFESAKVNLAPGDDTIQSREGILKAEKIAACKKINIFPWSEIS